mmetsp:Transcript_74755/g.132047  ORF Transcript_74755/g.132047 Transcript_74755/m.132047 type:complete len:116 (+) Transcript_74755:1398-1745(+)
MQFFSRAAVFHSLLHFSFRITSGYARGGSASPVEAPTAVSDWGIFKLRFVFSLVVTHHGVSSIRCWMPAPPRKSTIRFFVSQFIYHVQHVYIVCTTHQSKWQRCTGMGCVYYKKL